MFKPYTIHLCLRQLAVFYRNFFHHDGSQRPISETDVLCSNALLPCLTQLLSLHCSPSALILKPVIEKQPVATSKYIQQPCSALQEVEDNFLTSGQSML